MYRIVITNEHNEVVEDIDTDTYLLAYEFWRDEEDEDALPQVRTEYAGMDNELPLFHAALIEDARQQGIIFDALGIEMDRIDG